MPFEVQRCNSNYQAISTMKMSMIVSVLIVVDLAVVLESFVKLLFLNLSWLQWQCLDDDAKSRLVDGVMMAIPPFDDIGLYNRKTSTDIGAQLWYQVHSCTPKQQLNLIGKTTSTGTYQSNLQPRNVRLWHRTEWRHMETSHPTGIRHTGIMNREPDWSHRESETLVPGTWYSKYVLMSRWTVDLDNGVYRTNRQSLSLNIVIITPDSRPLTILILVWYWMTQTGLKRYLHWWIPV